MKLVEITLIGESKEQLNENIRIFRNMNITTVSQLIEAIKHNIGINFKFGNFIHYAGAKPCEVKLLVNDYNNFYDVFAVSSGLSVAA